MKCNQITVHRVNLNYFENLSLVKNLVYDHGAISIAICRSNTQGSSKFFDRVTEKIEKHKELNVSGRHIRVRYVKERGIDGSCLLNYLT